MSSNQNTETLFEVVRNQQSTIREMECALKVCRFDQVQKDNFIKELERRIQNFVDEFQINESWEAFKNEQDKLIMNIMGEYDNE